MKNYRINNFEDNLDPEESLFDSISRDAAIEKPIGPGFFVFFYFALVSALVIFGFAGFRIGVLNGEYFDELAQMNQFISVPVSAQRGLIYSRNGEVLASSRVSYSLWAIPSKISDRDALFGKLSPVLGAPEESIRTLFDKNGGRASFLLQEEIDAGQKEKIESLSSSGLVVVSNYKRNYKNGSAYSHLLGYVSAVDKIGLSGVESRYEEILKGRNGQVLVARFQEGMSRTEPEKGFDLVLNTDSRLQERLYRELSLGLGAIGLRSGAAVALDPRNGQVLALVSLPSFDSNILSTGLTQEDFQSLSQNRHLPFLNRAISGRFSPGSTIKPLIALAALNEKTITPEKKINAPGLITIKNPYDPEIVYTFRDWRDHGRVNMREAIANSSDIYFYTVGGGFYDVPALGIERIAKYMKMFRIDSILGIDLPGEVAGFVPTPEWKLERRGEAWYQGDTFNVSIGQGDVLTTPLWLTAYIGAVGQGAMYKPYVVEKIIDGDGKTAGAGRPELLFELPFDEADLKVVREGMKLAAEVGTARVLGNLPFEVGAKSGTAEVIKGQSTSSWISVFAPYDNPQIALTIMMESGKEGSYIPTQIAYRILKEYFEN